MSALNYKIQHQIISTLEKCVLTSAPFKIDFPESGGVVVKITMRDDLAYGFEMSHNAHNNQFTTIETPGAAFFTDTHVHGNLETAIKRIEPWSKNLIEDLKAKSIIYGEFEKMWHDMQENFDSHEEDANAHFTANEKQEWLARLEEIERKIDEFFEQNKIPEAEFSEVKKDIDELKPQLHTLPKKVWHRILGRKLMNAAKAVASTEEGRKFLIWGTKHLLEEGTKDITTLLQ